MPEFRFYAELGDFLPPALRGRSFTREVAAHQSAKHVIEALGVPHTEIGLLLINGEPAALNCRLSPADRVAVLPTLHCLPPPACGDSAPSFVADAHLGRLARYLRFAGFDTLWHNAWRDAELVALAAADGRIVLTRDRDLLMHRAVQAGCYVRGEDPLEQLLDVAWRYSLDLQGGNPGRCLECNALLRPVARSEVADLLLPGTLAGFAAFWRCPDCRKVFWRGSHWRRMKASLEVVACRLANARPEAMGRHHGV
ncbi:Mut7-C RNAse domain-containing protein [Propionivibrio limicola]|uniref:Mut7-C RNAse domain-containing protein n=1 Tax=Propionivibrio limicola TaxID=167645 RepID=UPI00129178A4|nr:Mut7-C RNAse domain-containing protein [Propionivibrio limicola]